MHCSNILHLLQHKSIDVAHVSVILLFLVFIIAVKRSPLAQFIMQETTYSHAYKCILSAKRTRLLLLERVRIQYYIDSFNSINLFRKPLQIKRSKVTQRSISYKYIGSVVVTCKWLVQSICNVASVCVRVCVCYCQWM